MSPATLHHDHPADLLTLRDWSDEDIRRTVATACVLKRSSAHYDRLLAGRAMAMLFEKPSLRTRVSFEIGMQRLGGTVTYLDHQTSRIGERESIRDIAQNLGRWVDVIVLRTFSHQTVTDMATWSEVPVVNALSDRYHPCQALADLQALTERLGPLAGRRIAYIGDGNNVCHSLMIGCAAMGASMTVITPPGFEPDPDITTHAVARARSHGASVTLSHDPGDVSRHDAVYTDTWVSMGDEEEYAARLLAFAGYQVNRALLDHAGPSSLFMHCLPAHRGDEVTDEVLDGPRAIVLDQAENRLYAQCAALLRLLVPALTLHDNQPPMKSRTAPHPVVLHPAVTERPVRARAVAG